MRAEFNRLHPAPGRVDVDSLLEDWVPHAPEGSTRPRLAINFAVTADGATVLADGKSGGIGDDGDLALFRALRDRVDAVMAGTQTIAVEGYRRLVRDEARRAERVGRGLLADPLAVTISRSGVLPLEAPIFSDPEQATIAYIPAGGRKPHLPPAPAEPGTEQAQAVAEGMPEPGSGNGSPPIELVELGPVTPAAALADLASRGVRSVLCEGGARLVSALVGADLVDDVFITVAPKLAGGGEGMTHGAPLVTPTPLELRHVAEHGGSLFIRWSRTG